MSSDVVLLNTRHRPRFLDSSTLALFLLYCCDLNIYPQARIAESGLKNTQPYPSAPEPTNRNQNLCSLQIHTLKLIPRVFKYLLSTVLNLSLKQSCERTLTALADCRALLQCLKKRWKRTCWFQTSLRLQDGMAGHGRLL